MATLEEYPVMNFSGGVRRDKSFFEFDKNELLEIYNMHIDERGRISLMRGMHIVGPQLSADVDNSFFFFRNAATPASSFLVNDNASTSTIVRLISSQNTGTVSVGDTTITLFDTSSFAASGSVEIEGDVISYTGISGSNLTGVTGISFQHPARHSVNQWATLTPATALDGQRGLYYAVLNNVCFIQGRNGNIQQIDNNDAVTMTNVSGEPTGLFLTNYRDRLFTISEISPRNRVFFSARGDGTSWTTASDFFDVEDQHGEDLVGQKVLHDTLYLFKYNSVWHYNELELKQDLDGVGAWNHRVIQEIDGSIFTFCPRGIFEIRGQSAREIGLPVQDYWRNFRPKWDSVDGTGNGRVVTNVFAGKFEDKYILYLGDLTKPSTLQNIFLVYDTTLRNWTVYQKGTNDSPFSFSDFTHLGSHQYFAYGGRNFQAAPALFAGNVDNYFIRLFDDKFTGAANNIQGGDDLFRDIPANGTIAPVYGSFQTPLYDLTHPALFKQFKDLRVFTESGVWSVEYRVQNEAGISQYKPLGVVSKTEQVLPFPSDAAGRRIGLRFGTNYGYHASTIDYLGKGEPPTLNGFVFEKTEITTRR